MLPRAELLGILNIVNIVSPHRRRKRPPISSQRHHSDMHTKNIQEIEHTADWAIRVRGRTLEELFANAALGMAMLMAEVNTIKPEIERRVELEAYDLEALLVSWLSELLWFNEETDAIFVRFDIELLTETRLEARVWGAPAQSQWKHIKAVTFHELAIMSTKKGYEVTVVFDV
jgi:SHS2 domain-containing protein